MQSYARCITVEYIVPQDFAARGQTVFRDIIGWTTHGELESGEDHIRLMPVNPTRTAPLLL